jgi:hypothetical protein
VLAHPLGCEGRPALLDRGQDLQMRSVVSKAIAIQPLDCHLLFGIEVKQ